MKQKVGVGCINQTCPGIYVCPVTGENLEHLSIEELCVYYRNRLDDMLRLMKKYTYRNK